MEEIKNKTEDTDAADNLKILQSKEMRNFYNESKVFSRVTKGFHLLKILIIIFFLIGLAITMWQLNVLKDSFESKNWPIVEGRVVSSEVKTFEDKRRDSQGHEKIVFIYGAEISYEYFVDKIKYSSNKISFGDYKSESENRAKEIVDKYPVEKQIKVHYNPENHSLSVIESGASWNTYFILAIGLFFSFFGFLYVAGYAYQHFRK